MRVLHPSADLCDQWEDDERGNSMADERRHNRNQRGKDAHHTIQTQVANLLSDAYGNGMQQARAIHSLTQSQTASGQDYYRPQEVIEVFLRQDSRAKEEGDRNDGNYAHVPEETFELVAETPQHDGGNRYDGDEPLDAGEFVSHWSDGYDGRVAAWSEGYKK